MSRSEPARLTYALGSAADVATLPETSDTVASLKGLFPYLTSVPVAQGGAYPRRQDINAILKRLAGSQYFMEGGHVWSYDPARVADYSAGDLVYYEVTADLHISCPDAGGSATDVTIAPYITSTGDASGLPPTASFLFVRNAVAYATGTATPTIESNGATWVNSAYWSLVLTDQQFATLWHSIQTGGGATVTWLTRTQVMNIMEDTPAQFIVFDVSAVGTGAAYIYSSTGELGTYPGTALTPIGGSRYVWTFGDWTDETGQTPDITGARAITISAGTGQTDAIDWLTGTTPLNTAMGCLVRVSADSAIFSIENWEG